MHVYLVCREWLEEDGGCAGERKLASAHRAVNLSFCQGLRTGSSALLVVPPPLEILVADQPRSRTLLRFTEVDSPRHLALELGDLSSPCLSRKAYLFLEYILL